MAENWNDSIILVIQVLRKKLTTTIFFSGLNLTFSGGNKRCTIHIATVNISITLCVYIMIIYELKTRKVEEPAPLLNHMLGTAFGREGSL